MGFKVSLLHFLLVSLISLKKFRPESSFLLSKYFCIVLTLPSWCSVLFGSSVVLDLSYFHVETIGHPQDYQVSYKFMISIQGLKNCTISSSAISFSSCPQSFPASGSFPVIQHFTSVAQSFGALVSASVLPVNIQHWFLLGLTGLISLLSKGLSDVFSSTTLWKHQFFGAQPSLWSNSHICTWLLKKPWLWLYGPLSAKWCICFLMLSRFVTLIKVAAFIKSVFKTMVSRAHSIIRCN